MSDEIQPPKFSGYLAFNQHKILGKDDGVKCEAVVKDYDDCYFYNISFNNPKLETLEEIRISFKKKDAGSEREFLTMKVANTEQFSDLFSGIETKHVWSKEFCYLYTKRTHRIMFCLRYTGEQWQCKSFPHSIMTKLHPKSYKPLNPFKEKFARSQHSKRIAITASQVASMLGFYDGFPKTTDDVKNLRMSLGRKHEIDIIYSLLRKHPEWEYRCPTRLEAGDMGCLPDGIIRMDPEFRMNHLDISKIKRKGSLAHINTAVFEAKTSRRNSKLQYYHIPQIQLEMQMAKVSSCIFCIACLSNCTVTLYLVHRDRKLEKLLLSVLEENDDKLTKQYTAECKAFANRQRFVEKFRLETVVSKEMENALANFLETRTERRNILVEFQKKKGVLLKMYKAIKKNTSLVVQEYERNMDNPKKVTRLFDYTTKCAEIISSQIDAAKNLLGTMQASSMLSSKRKLEDKTLHNDNKRLK